MAINKIIYFIVEKALVERGELLTGAKIEAWEHGPVFREIYHSFKQHGDGPITSRARRFEASTLSMVEAEETFGKDDEELFGDLTPGASVLSVRAWNAARPPQPTFISHAVFTLRRWCFQVNISKHEQRVLHALAGPPQSITLRGGAQGGRIVHRRDAQTGKIVAVDCFTRPSTACKAGAQDRLSGGSPTAAWASSGASSAGS